ncbi:dCTP pyrophosphatase 1-like [Gracilinanus agilis]|uniref:dCTP pyrophosphatase 1 n=1 Tax=Gracilinanus agilis TaxID=191870 RepID=UPI001CFED0FB|nr:dCTP pyrophosphatase 1 [Gracilinanus agilis]XP_044534544.1 dCTP pyrophosphatase 1-like [Gracilinanus agilis]
MPGGSDPESTAAAAEPAAAGAGCNTPFSFSPEPTLEDIRRLQSEFAAERDWDQFHKPRNLLLALVGEVGELAELFQWKPDGGPGPLSWSEAERGALGEELSDVLIYLVALASRCHIDLPQAVLAKMETNRRHYPVHLARGSSCKYTELPHEATPKAESLGPAPGATECAPVSRGGEATS